MLMLMLSYHLMYVLSAVGVSCILLTCRVLCSLGLVLSSVVLSYDHILTVSRISDKERQGRAWQQQQCTSTRQVNMTKQSKHLEGYGLKKSS